MGQLEFYFDFSCPYAYLASTRVEAAAARAKAELVLRPILLGGLFKGLGHATTNLSETLSPSKARHNRADMDRYARLYGVPLEMPAGHPIRTVTALRAFLAAGASSLALAQRFFRAYWVEGRDLSKREEVAAILREAGLDAEAVLARAETDAVKDDLRRRTDEALARGVFGVPTFFVGDALYFGQDRLGEVEVALGASAPSAPAASTPAASASPCPAIEFWFDYSSPFTYVASERMDAVLGPDVRWRPMLLGGLFRQVGQVDVPLFAQPESKRRHSLIDLERQAQRAGAPFRFPTRFPMNTVLALRMTLAAEAVAERARVRAFIREVYRAYWSEDRDISSPEVLSELAGRVGLDGPALVERAATAPVKDALRANTDEAAATGVFGAPTVVVRSPGAAEASLYWGADRLELAALAAAGDARVA